MPQFKLSLLPVLLVLSSACPAAGPTSNDGDPARSQGEAGVAPPQFRCDNSAPLLGVSDPATPGYIVVFKDGVPPGSTAEGFATKYGFKLKFVYTTALKGFSAEFSDQVLAGIRCETAVKYVEREGRASTMGM